MLAPALLLVAALAAQTAFSEAAQTASSEAAQTPSTEEAAGSSRSPLLVLGVAQRPAELVAARVRSVLLSNSDNAWFELADALPELALEGGADLTTTFEAAQLAEQVGSAVGRASQTPQWASVRAVRAWASSITPTRLITFVVAVLTLSMVAVTMLRRRRPRVTSARRRVRPTGAGTGVTARFAEARHLASAGLAVPEIARRTGMARDAVTLLVGLRSS